MGPIKICLLILGAGLLISPSANAKCINVTLPNVLNLGSCLGPTLVTCPDTSDGLLVDLARILRCVLQILPQVGNPVSVLHNLVGLLEAVVARLGLSPDIGALSKILCEPLGLPVFNCGAISPGNITCETPIDISLPSVFNIGHCLNTTLLFCAEGSTITEPILNELVRSLGCILSAAPEGLQLDLARSLVCPLVNVVTSSLDEFTEFLPFRFLTRGITRTVQQLTNTLVGSVPSC
ncbi:putative secreted protein [Ixodes scapularis]